MLSVLVTDYARDPPLRATIGFPGGRPGNAQNRTICAYPPDDPGQIRLICEWRGRNWSEYVQSVGRCHLRIEDGCVWRVSGGCEVAATEPLPLLLTFPVGG
jgi:hypothetical protein